MADDILKVDEAERRKYLDFVMQRALKIAELASAEGPLAEVASARDYLLARQIIMLVRPAAMLFEAQMRGAFLHWFADQIRGEHGICFLCAKAKTNPKDSACDECLKAMEQDSIEIGLGDVFGMRS